MWEGRTIIISVLGFVRGFVFSHSQRVGVSFNCSQLPSTIPSFVCMALVSELRGVREELIGSTSPLIMHASFALPKPHFLKDVN